MEQKKGNDKAGRGVPAVGFVLAFSAVLWGAGHWLHRKEAVDVYDAKSITREVCAADARCVSADGKYVASGATGFEVLHVSVRASWPLDPKEEGEMMKNMSAAFDRVNRTWPYLDLKGLKRGIKVEVVKNTARPANARKTRIKTGDANPFK